LRKELVDGRLGNGVGGTGRWLDVEGATGAGGGAEAGGIGRLDWKNGNFIVVMFFSSACAT